MSKKSAEKIQRTCQEILKVSVLTDHYAGKERAREVLPYYCKKNKVKEETIKKIMEL